MWQDKSSLVVSTILVALIAAAVQFAVGHFLCAKKATDKASDSSQRWPQLLETPDATLHI